MHTALQVPTTMLQILPLSFTPRSNMKTVTATITNDT